MSHEPVPTPLWLRIGAGRATVPPASDAARSGRFARLRRPMLEIPLMLVPVGVLLAVALRPSTEASPAPAVSQQAPAPGVSVAEAPPGAPTEAPLPPILLPESLAGAGESPVAAPGEAPELEKHVPAAPPMTPDPAPRPPERRLEEASREALVRVFGSLSERKLALEAEIAGLVAAKAQVEASLAALSNEMVAWKVFEADPIRAEGEKMLLELQALQEKLASEFVADSPFIRRVKEQIAGLRAYLEGRPEEIQTASALMPNVRVIELERRLDEIGIHLAATAAESHVVDLQLRAVTDLLRDGRPLDQALQPVERPSTP